jgi:hypothetical protein
VRARHPYAPLDRSRRARGPLRLDAATIAPKLGQGEDRRHRRDELEANAVLRSIVRRDTGERYEAFLTRCGLESLGRVVCRETDGLPAGKPASAPAGALAVTASFMWWYRWVTRANPRIVGKRPFNFRSIFSRTPNRNHHQQVAKPPTSQQDAEPALTC